MGTIAARLALKEQLPRAWPAFFERHGSFTAVQEAAMPALLAGHDALVVAPTAGGKTEAALAPLVERYCTPAIPGAPAARGPAGPTLLYIVPTRALVNDLAARLHGPLNTLNLRLAVRTGDRDTLRAGHPPDLLITTPESLDALLASRARLFANLRAVALDELHLLDGTPRGDQLRVLLRRLRRLRAYAAASGDAPTEDLQVVGLSATVTRPARVAARYCVEPRIVTVGGARALDVETLPLAADNVAELRDYLNAFRARGWRKALAFCATRAEVEAYAAVLRERSPFGDAVYVHYSNIEAERRRETERRFAADAAALLFATGTLELGIDIGDIDVVLLVGPPGNPASFMQRIGRGNRRKGVTRVACFYRTPLERHLFEALLTGATAIGNAGVLPEHDGAPTNVGRLEAGVSNAYDDGVLSGGDTPFRPAVAVQQIFSLLKASPTGAVRRAELSTLFTGLLDADDIDAILAELRRRDYLAAGRPGDWTAGPRLNDLFDQQGRKNCPLSVYSNIQGAAGRPIEVRDQHTGTVVATVDVEWLDHPVLTLEGRAVTVEWQDGEALWVSTDRSADATRRMSFRSRGQLLSYELARLLPATLGLASGAAPLVPAPRGWLCYHWLGDVYGQALFDLLRYQIYASQTENMGLCVELGDEPRALPAWTEEAVARYCADNYRELEPMLALGPLQSLLPTPLRRRAVVAQFDVPRFLAAVDALRPARAPEQGADDLLVLLDQGS